MLYTYYFLKNQVTENLKKHNITMQQYNVLRILAGQFPKGITTGDIRSRMMDKMSDASRLVERLQTLDLVEKRTDKNDRRLVNVTISQNGLDLVQSIKGETNVFDKLFAHIDAKELEMLNSLLDKLRG